MSVTNVGKFFNESFTSFNIEECTLEKSPMSELIAESTSGKAPISLNTTVFTLDKSHMSVLIVESLSGEL